MTQIYKGLKVVEFLEGEMLPLAGMIFADNGAEVFKVEPLAGDWSRNSPGFLMWNRGKKSIVLDLESENGREAARAMALGADVVLESFSPGDAERYGLDAAGLMLERPDLVVCSISGFGAAKGFERFAPYEAIVAAKSGRLYQNDELSGAHDASNRAIFIAAPMATFSAAVLAVQAVTASLISTKRTGRGQHVSTSVLDGLSAATMRLAFERDGDELVPVRRRAGGAEIVLRGIRLSFTVAECSDGRYFQMCARQPHHFRNWMRAVGLTELLQDDRFADVPTGLHSVADADELEVLLREGMRKKTQAEWLRIFTEEIDVGGDPFLTFGEFLEHPQMLENERIVKIADPEHGVVTQVGQLVLFTETPSIIEASAPRLGEHQDLLGELISVSPQKVASATSGQRVAVETLPLEGKTILELAYYLAAPLGPTLCAELGARVIKVEPLEGDPFRKSGLEFIHIGNGKESIALDLKSDGGRKILTQLIERSDALVHNFRPGVPERLGFDYETVKQINPRLVYLYSSAYGSNGPQRLRPAFHSTPNALSGGGVLQAGEGNVPVDDSYPDPCAGVTTAMALAMALLAQEMTGSGQYLETTMLTASGYVHSGRLVKYKGAPEVAVVDSEQCGLGALYRLYECESGWIFVAVLRPEEWDGLARAVGREAWLADPRFLDDEMRRKNDATLTAELVAIFATEDAADWERELTRAGTPAASAGDRSFEEFLVEEHLVEEGEHSIYGTYYSLPPRVRFSGVHSRRGGPVTIGQDTVPLLLELGYTSDEVNSLLVEKVVGSPGPTDQSQ